MSAKITIVPSATIRQMNNFVSFLYSYGLLGARASFAEIEKVHYAKNILDIAQKFASEREKCLSKSNPQSLDISKAADFRKREIACYRNLLKYLQEEFGIEEFSVQISI